MECDGSKVVGGEGGPKYEKEREREREGPAGLRGNKKRGQGGRAETRFQSSSASSSPRPRRRPRTSPPRSRFVSSYRALIILASSSSPSSSSSIPGPLFGPEENEELVGGPNPLDETAEDDGASALGLAFTMSGGAAKGDDDSGGASAFGPGRCRDESR